MDKLKLLKGVRQLTKGGNSSIYTAYHEDLKTPVVIKRINKLLPGFSLESDILNIVSHLPNIVRILDRFVILERNNYVEYIIMEFCSSDLFTLIENCRTMNMKLYERVIKRLFFQILQGLKNIHDNGIIHRDIKPANVLIEDQVVKITDFGWSVMYDEVADNKCLTFGTTIYWAPEIIFGKSQYNQKIDIWAAACTISEMILHDPCFTGLTSSKVLISIYSKIPFKSPTEEEYYERLNRPLFLQCKNGYRRQNQHDFITRISQNFQDELNARDLFVKMFQIIPELRISAQEALKHPFFYDI
jgi:serine/threonine protein kinase